MDLEANSIDCTHGPRAQARHWLVRLKSGAATLDDLTAFGAWRGSDAANEAAYRDVLMDWRLLGPVIERSRAAESMSRMPVANSAQQSRRRLLTGAGLAAAAVMLPLAVSVPMTPAGATVIETRKGERRRAKLANGVVVELNTDSRLVSWADEGLRRVRLDRGEALLAVGGGERLRATAGHTDIFADRARFLLSFVDETEPRVLCIAGSIEVRAEGRSFRLGANETIDSGTEAVAHEARTAVADALEWRRGVLVFEGRAAGEVITELNRYRDGRVFLPGSRSDTRISGVIHLDRADAAVDHIARSLGMRVTRLPGGIAILRD